MKSKKVYRARKKYTNDLKLNVTKDYYAGMQITDILKKYDLGASSLIYLWIKQINPNNKPRTITTREGQGLVLKDGKLDLTKYKHTPGANYPLALRKAVVKDYLDGHSPSSLCLRYNLGSSALIYQWITRYNENSTQKKNTKREKRKSYSQSVRKRVLQDYHNGMAPSDISKKYKLSSTSLIYYWGGKSNIKPLKKEVPKAKKSYILWITILALTLIIAAQCALLWYLTNS